MKVAWTVDAEQDREAIWQYLYHRDAVAAARIDQLFGAAAARLADFPQLGHPGEIAGTRELIPHRRYRMVYEISQDTVLILAVVHSARQWPPLAE